MDSYGYYTPKIPLFFKKDIYLFYYMVEMKLNLPQEINILLRRYVLENNLKSKERAITFILKGFLHELYRVKQGEK